MLMAAAATHMDSAHSSSSSISPPWRPVSLVPNHHHDQQAHLNLDLITPSPSTASPPRHIHHEPHQLRPAARRVRVAKQQRRPRPSRKLPTTYISADLASFRRMVHQVTGADDVQPHPDLLCPPPLQAPPSRAGATMMTTTTLLPTLDTSAFLLGEPGRGTGSGRAPPALPGAACCHGSAAPSAPLKVEMEACGGGRRGLGGGGEYSYSNDSGGGGGIPTLESSWDAALF